jgi:hypothetical protein
VQGGSPEGSAPYPEVDALAGGAVVVGGDAPAAVAPDQHPGRAHQALARDSVLPGEDDLPSSLTTMAVSPVRERTSTGRAATRDPLPRTPQRRRLPTPGTRPRARRERPAGRRRTLPWWSCWSTVSSFLSAWWRAPPARRTDGPARRGRPRGGKPEKIRTAITAPGLDQTPAEAGPPTSQPFAEFGVPAGGPPPSGSLQIAGMSPTSPRRLHRARRSGRRWPRRAGQPARDSLTRGPCQVPTADARDGRRGHQP